MHYKQHCICVAALPQFTVTCGGIGHASAFSGTGHRPAAGFCGTEPVTGGGDVLCNGEPLIPAGISGLHADLRRSVLAQAAEQLGISVKSVDNALQRARRKLHSEGVLQ